MVRLFPLEGIDEFRISESVVSTYLQSSLPNPAPRARLQRFSILAPVGVFSEWLNVFSGVGGVSGFVCYPFHH